MRSSNTPCLGKTRLFFSYDEAAIQAAKAICAGCSGRLPCLDRAIHEHHEDGVWGGLDSAERQAVAVVLVAPAWQLKSTGWQGGEAKDLRRRPMHPRTNHA